MFSNPDFDSTVRYAPKFGHKIEKMDTVFKKPEKILAADPHLPPLPPQSLFTPSPSYRAACGP